MSMDYKILSKFIKDLSFEIPDSKTILSLEQNITKYLSTLKHGISMIPK